jgi:hypothetical protein
MRKIYVFVDTWTKTKKLLLHLGNCTNYMYMYTTFSNHVVCILHTAGFEKLSVLYRVPTVWKSFGNLKNISRALKKS